MSISNDKFEQIINIISNINGSISGRDEEREDIFCIYKYEQETLDMFKELIDFKYVVENEFIDGNGDVCLDVRNISS
jgi:hypothetical protein